MAYSITKNADGDTSLGNLRGEIVTLQPAASDYPAGGYAISGIPPTTGNVGMDKIEGVIPIGGQGAAIPVWNPTTGKIQMFPVGGGGASSNAYIMAGAVSTATSTTIGVVSNVITVAIANNLKVGQFVLLKSFTAGGALNGLIVQVATASATGFTANYPTPNITAATADVTGTYQVIGLGALNPVIGGAAAVITNSLATSSLLTMTCANSFVPGQLVNIQGLTNGANANGVTVRVATASATQFTAAWTGTSFTTAADTGTATPLVLTDGGAPIITGTIPVDITNSLATASSAGTAGVVTLTAENSFVPNQIVNIEGLTNGAAINGDNLAINAASLTPLVFVSNTKTAAFSTGADTGTASLWVVGSTSGLPPELPAGTDLSAQAFLLLVIGL